MARPPFELCMIDASYAAWLLVPPTVVALLTHRFSLLWRRQRAQADVAQS